ncbi:Protein chibby 1 [Gaertneriomyces sp. JEL0708]|nr:Protein chibby 1 [Gaertneriomyces sp. JEL0708]
MLRLPCRKFKSVAGSAEFVWVSYLSSASRYFPGFGLAILPFEEVSTARKMASAWEAVKEQTRRLSESVRRQPSIRVPPPRPLSAREEPSYNDPIHLDLGGQRLVYEDGEWVNEGSVQLSGKPSSKEVDALTQRNKQLEKENQMLKFKANVLLDMLTGTKLDMLRLQHELQGRGGLPSAKNGTALVPTARVHGSRESLHKISGSPKDAVSRIPEDSPTDSEIESVQLDSEEASTDPSLSEFSESEGR